MCESLTNSVLLYSTGNSAQCYVAVWVGGEFGGEWIHVYVWLSPFAIHLKLSHFYLAYVHANSLVMSDSLQPYGL